MLLVAEHDGHVVAMARLQVCRDHDVRPDTTAELRALYVSPGAWSTGQGGLLLDAGYARMPHPLQVLWTLEGNVRARAFYERRGFVADGATKVRDLGGPREVRYRALARPVARTATGPAPHGLEGPGELRRDPPGRPADDPSTASWPAS